MFLQPLKVFINAHHNSTLREGYIANLGSYTQIFKNTVCTIQLLYNSEKKSTSNEVHEEQFDANGKFIYLFKVFINAYIVPHSKSITFF